jgi:hypothetical protein
MNKGWIILDRTESETFTQALGVFHEDIESAKNMAQTFAEACHRQEGPMQWNASTPANLWSKTPDGSVMELVELIVKAKT